MSKRIKIVEKPEDVNLSNKPRSMEEMADDAMHIISSELSRYRNKTDRGISLDLKEGRAVREYLESLLKIAREQREAAKSEDLTEVKESDLQKLIEKAFGSKYLESLSSEDEDNS